MSQFRPKSQPRPRSWKAALGQHKSPLRDLVDQPRSQSKLARLLLALALAGIVFCGLFPFDFDLHDLSGRFRKFDTGFSQYFTSGDTIENLLFFVPLGFALAAVVPIILRRRRLAGAARTLTVPASVITGLIVSVTIELLQCTVSERDPSLTDIINNTIGAGIGAGVYLFVGEPAMSSAAAMIDRVQRRMGLSAVAIITVIYAVGMCGVPLMLGADAARLSTWNPSYGMALGNEMGGTDRLWNGSAWNVAIASRAASEAQVKLLLADSPPREIFGDALLAMYDLRGTPPLKDRTGHLDQLDISSRAATQPQLPPHTTTTPAGLRPPPTSAPKDAPPAPLTARPWELTEDTWVRTAQPVGALSDAIVRSGQFTVSFMASSPKREQFMASRILTISRGPYERNLTFAQDGPALVVRVRTGATGKNGEAPEFVLGDVFLDDRPHHIVATFADGRLHLYVDNLNWHESVRITPEAAVVWSLYPRPSWMFQLTGGDIAIVAVIYRAIAFLPLGTLIAATVNLVRRSYRERVLIAAAALLATMVLFEGLLNAVGGERFSVLHVGACLIFGAIGISVIGIRRSLPWAV